LRGSNPNKLPFQIDSLVDNIDVNITIDRATFEELIKHQLDDIRNTLMNLMSTMTINKEQIYSVEMVGGSTRIPAIKQLIEEVWGITTNSSLNADEAVSIGCGLQAAAKSNKFLTKNFDIEDMNLDTKENHMENKEVEALTNFESTSTRMPQEMINHCIDYEVEMITEDIEEISRQEAKNMLEEQLYKYRDALTNNSEEFEEEEGFRTLRDYFEQTESWLYEEGEEAPEQTYTDILKSFHDKMKIFQIWRENFMQMKKRKDEQERFREQQKLQQINQPRYRNSEQSHNENSVPIVSRKYPHDGENEGSCRKNPMNTGGHSLPTHHNQCHSRQNRLPMYKRSADPFSGFGRSAFFSDPLFGW